VKNVAKINNGELRMAASVISENNVSPHQCGGGSQRKAENGNGESSAAVASVGIEMASWRSRAKRHQWGGMKMASAMAAPGAPAIENKSVSGAHRSRARGARIKCNQSAKIGINVISNRRERSV
jgi:hypothetical protein